MDIIETCELIENKQCTILSLQESQTEEVGEKYKNNRRYQIAKEIYNTEIAYIQSLQNLQNVFKEKLTEGISAGQVKGITQKQINKIFINVEELIPVNKMFFELLSPRLEKWHDEQLIGDVFITITPFFGIYSKYQNDYQQSLDTLGKCMKNLSFASFLSELEGKVEDSVSKLGSFIIKPIQRIPRYSLLLHELYKKTNDDHPDKQNLSLAADKIDKLLEKINVGISSNDLRNLFLKLGSEIKGLESLVKPHRQLLRAGVVNIKSNNQFNRLKNKEQKQLHIWIFNDIFVYLTSSKSKKRVNIEKYAWPISLLWLVDLPDEPSQEKMEKRFKLIGPRGEHVICFDKEENGEGMKNDWMSYISDQVKRSINDDFDHQSDEINRYGSYKFPGKNGGEYEGWWKLGKMNGHGKFSIFNNVYIGDWEEGHKSGFGRFESLTGEVYEGTWVLDSPHGNGIYRYSNDDVYSGEWKEGMKAGRGIHFYANGDKYEGEWANNVQNGMGIYFTTSGFLYSGGWLNGRVHGEGSLISPNGRHYEGQFKHGVKEGEGKLDFANGDFYIGQWKNDKMEGFGVFHSEIDGVYNGTFIGGFKDGFGEMIYFNGDQYKGYWKRNKYEGSGTLLLSSGGCSKYIGHFEKGKFNGKGILFYRNGSRFEGYFKDDKMNGSGVFVTENNSLCYEGKWVEGRCVGRSTITAGYSQLSGHLTANGTLQRGDDHFSFLLPPILPSIRVDL